MSTRNPTARPHTALTLSHAALLRVGLSLHLVACAAPALSQPAPATPALPIPVTPAPENPAPAPATGEAAPAPTPAPAVRPQTGPSGTVAVVNQHAARALARIAIVDLRCNPSPGPADYAVCAELLSAAADLDPTAVDLPRLALAAAQESGDRALTLPLARRVARLDPADTVAQLQLLEARAGMAETAEGKLEVYAKILGPTGDAVDPAVRSRVALQSALLKKQRGDMQGYASDLATSAKLDSSHKAAAQLALEFFNERVDDAGARVELLTNLLLADPLDARTHANLAGEMSAQGAHNASLRFYENADRILARTGERFDTAASVSKLVQSALASSQLSTAARPQGPQAVLTSLHEGVEGPRREAQAARDNARLDGRSLDGIPDPAEMRLDLPYERVRLALALALGDSAITQRSFTDLAATINAIPATDPAHISSRIELAFIRAWLNQQLPEVTAFLTELKAGTGSPESITRLEAWLAHRAGDSKAALAMLETMKDDSLARLVKAQIAIDNQDPDDNVQAALMDVIALGPSTPAALWAQTVYRQRTGSNPQLGEAAARFQALADGIPKWIDDAAKDPGRFVTVTVSPVRTSLDPADTAFLTVRMRHNLPVPLALGPGEVLDSRFLFSPTVDFGRGNDPLRAVPEVVNLDRRLRLLPREELTSIVWPDAGPGGWAVENALNTVARLRWKIFNGFQMLNNQATVTGFGAVTEIGPILRANVATEDGKALAQQIIDAPGAGLATAVIAAKRYALNIAAGTGSTADMGRVNQALVDRFNREDRTARILMLAHMPTERQCTPIAPASRAITQACATINDPAVLMVLLATRVTDPASPLFAHAASLNDPALTRVAARTKERLTGNLPSYVNLTVTVLPPPGEQQALPGEATSAAPKPAAQPPTPAAPISAGPVGIPGLGGPAPKPKPAEPAPTPTPAPIPAPAPAPATKP
jgi:hypothetical protein